MSMSEQQIDLKLLRVWSRASKTVFDNIQKDIQDRGIRFEQFMILELLYNKGSHPIQKISDVFSIPSGSITYVVDKLEKTGYVERQPSPDDRRSSIVVLTEKGKELFDDLFPKHVEYISENFSFATSEEKLQLIEILKKIGIGAMDV
ncbi:MarR family winged helix-turn-helix transcriptional regulator [Priestia koreensis]|uniref:MarR family winged helix-turn-helix transcriptional regulator n=1 Tax=Priestia koreensis TaxID=284581 RepID=UPI001F5749AC|nr:MarR family transcriptional regulator [Priestia koreensis]MCM3005165.1 MarR family transcriptional regulator [Priestia koreensis]UNL83151.1 MarR family transcriptional regulator [Priestia koreensis]